MSDGDRRPVSPSRLGTYTTCPRYYEFKYDQDIETADRTKRYLQQGLAMHETIERVSETVDRTMSSDVIHDTALAAFPEAWDEHVDPTEFESNAQCEYFRRQAMAGIDAYFDPDGGDGIDHARRSVAVETRLSTRYLGIPVAGYADQILETDTGLQILDYKRNLRGMLRSSTADRLEGHLQQEEHEPGRVKNAIQAAVYIEGVKETGFFEPGMDVQFSFYGLLWKDEFQSGPDGYSVTARGKELEITDIYEEHHDTIWKLIEESADGIAKERYTPEPWELIRENSCDDCDYKGMCPEYITTEVRHE